MNIDNKKLEKWLKQLVDFRNIELKEHEEFNNFSEEDFDNYENETNEIETLISNLSLKENNSDELKDLKTKYIYLAADFENYKKRSIKLQNESYSKAKVDIIFHFLSVYDNIETLCKQVENYKNISNDVKFFIDGCNLIFKQITQTLSDLNVQKIEVHKGDKFDLSIMNAISSIENTEIESGCVVSIVQSGWASDNRIIRYVNVIVAK